MRARFFGGPRDGQWIDINPTHPRKILVPVLDLTLECHAYWRYGTRLVWAGKDRLL